MNTGVVAATMGMRSDSFFQNRINLSQQEIFFLKN